MTPKEFFQVSSSRPESQYLLITDQDYLKRKVLEHCRNQVDEGARAFNWTVMDLGEEEAARFLNTARTLPWMAARRWMYVRLGGGDERILEYVKQPSERTTVVYEASRKPPKWPALPIIEIGGPVDPVRWVSNRAESEGYQIEPAAAELLVELVGAEFQILDSELEKQFLYALESRRISRESILELAVEARQYDVFALMEAVARQRPQPALQILNRLRESGVGAPQVISLLYSNFRRVLVAREMMLRGQPFQAVLKETNLWSYKNRRGDLASYSRAFLQEMLLKLQEADRTFKTTSLDERILLERLILEAASPRRRKEPSTGR